MHVMFWLPFLLTACLASAKSLRGRNAFKRAPNPKFVASSAGGFHVNGRCDALPGWSPRGLIYRFHSSALKFIGTNAYWLPTLTNDQDINDTFGNMTAAGIKVVRVWAFNGATAEDYRPKSSLIQIQM
jgi:mannan endo-1,4-beta-mannosidase